MLPFVTESSLQVLGTLASQVDALLNLQLRVFDYGYQDIGDFPCLPVLWKYWTPVL
jgi:hypothetical protein